MIQFRRNRPCDTFVNWYNDCISFSNSWST